MTIEDQLSAKYGPVLTIVQLAEVLHRSAEGLRISIRSNSDCSKSINAARLKVGRRVYFRTADVARLLSGD